MSVRWIDRAYNRDVFPLTSADTSPGPRYTVVVIGSGYGGAVMAARLARAGLDVCVLERGREILPGEYPRDEWHAQGELQIDDGTRRLGSRQALFDLRSGDGINALVGCGLGGTSLISAGVCAEPNPEVFRHTAWPEELRRQGALTEFFVRARSMLGAKPYPDALPELPKLRALTAVARAAGKSVVRPPIAVSFEEGVNAPGVEQIACTLCGDCCSGCNYGAKNTTLMNYLPEARRYGARLFTGTRVARLERCGTSWKVLGDVGHVKAGERARPFEVLTDVVILAAGTLGSTEILLRSQNAGLTLSEQLGKHFSGNGDVPAFAYDCTREVFGVGAGWSTPVEAGQPGPCITSLIDFRDSDQFTSSCWIEEGVIPGALKRWLAWILAAAARIRGEGDEPDLGHELAALVDGPYAGAVSRTATLLAMGHDASDGELLLTAEGRLRLRWPGAHRDPGIERILARLQDATGILGGTFIATPRMALPFTSDEHAARLITVHPLGGCALSDSAESGVVNHKGQVFSATHGTQVHAGLYVADGAIVPRSIGANPSLTIAALAEREAELLLEDHGWARNGARPVTPAAPTQRRAPVPGVRFSERMSGLYVSGMQPSNELPWNGWKSLTKASGHRPAVASSSCTLLLNLSSDDIQRFLETEPHTLAVGGSGELAALSREPLEITCGLFRIFSADPHELNTRRMEYELELHALTGEEYFLYGEKLLKDDIRFAVWTETTTLRISVHSGRTRAGAVLGSGYLRVAPEDFVRQLRTITVTNALDGSERMQWIARFGKFFAGNLFRIYGGVLAEHYQLEHAYRPRVRRPLRAPDPEVHSFLTDDGVTLRLTRYHAGDKGPVILAPGFGVTAASFAIDTVDTNIVEYLAARDYDTWLFDYRASPTLASARDDFSIDDIARHDWPTAVRHVLDETRADDLQVIAHCVGSMTLLVALLEGMTGVRSIVSSQLPLHAFGWWVTRLAAGLDVASLLRSAGIEALDVHDHDRISERLDALLRPLPVPDGEACRSITCRRIFALFGPSYTHANLNGATHDAIAEMFGISSLAAFEQLARIVRHGHVVDRRGANVYMRADRLHRLALPILFIAGENNHQFSPRSSEKTLELLASVNAPELYQRLCEESIAGVESRSQPLDGKWLYERQVIRGFAHLDCFIGHNAHRDVFPILEDYLARTHEAASRTSTTGSALGDQAASALQSTTTSVAATPTRFP